MIPPWVPFRAVRQCQICHKRKACMMGACLACANLVSGRRIRICLIGAVTPAHELWETAKPTNRWRVKDDQSNLMTVGRRKRNS
jgi:aerobic-type carbon monoxide dehydrogenase small subunit (CoxS/CutS family)